MRWEGANRAAWQRQDTVRVETAGSPCKCAESPFGVMPLKARRRRRQTVQVAYGGRPLGSGRPEKRQGWKPERAGTARRVRFTTARSRSETQEMKEEALRLMPCPSVEISSQWTMKSRSPNWRGKTVIVIVGEQVLRLEPGF